MGKGMKKHFISIVILACLLSTSFLLIVRPTMSTGSLSSSDVLLGAAAKWAGTGGRAAYIDWYDNLLAHPNPNWGSPASYYLSLRTDVISTLESEGFTVDTFASIPLSNLTQYNLVDCEGYFACEPAYEPAIQSYVFNGGGLILWQGSIAYLNAYSKNSYNSENLDSVSSWFGASSFINTGGTAYVSVSNPLGASLNVGDPLVTGVGMSCVGVTYMSADSQVVAVWQDGSTFAFTHQYGQGRVYWQARSCIDEPPTSTPAPTPTPTPTSTSMTFASADTLLAAGAKWAANGGTTVAYVDFYDNLIAHPNSYFDVSVALKMKNNITAILQGEGFTVDTFADIPANLSQYSLLYLEAYWACEPAYAPAIASFVYNGGGVYIRSGAIACLAYYTKNMNSGNDLTSVASWFGASEYVNTGGSAQVIVQSPLGASLNSGDLLCSGEGYSHAGIAVMSADSQVLATWDDGYTFAFAHTYGQGRVYWGAQSCIEEQQSSTPNPPPPPTPTPTPVTPPAQVCFSVEPVAVAPLVNVNASINGLETLSNPPPIGENFTVEIHLRNATTTNVPAGIAGIEVHFNFASILNYSTPIGFTNMLGQSGGALSSNIIYGISPGFYTDELGNQACSQPYTNAQFFDVAAAARDGWNGADGVIATITFQITNQPPAHQPDFYAPLTITFADIMDNNDNGVPFNVTQGSLHIDADPAVPAIITTTALNLKSQSAWIQSGVQLAQGLAVSDINISSLMINCTVPTYSSAQNIALISSCGGTPQLKVQFDRTQLVNLIASSGATFGNITLDLTGKLFSRTPIEGTCQVQVSSLAGDINCDGKVNLSDLIILATAYGSAPGTSRWNSNADMTGHGKIGLSDLVTLALHYGQHYP
jgi:hypothetical protein